MALFGQSGLTLLRIVYRFPRLTYWPSWDGWNYAQVISSHILTIYDWGIPRAIGLSWISWDLIDAKSTLAQVMFWRRQTIRTTNHYLSQYWHSALSPDGVTWPRWVKFVIFFPKFYAVVSYLLTSLFNYTQSFLSALKRYLPLLRQEHALSMFMPVLYPKLTAVDCCWKRQ